MQWAVKDNEKTTRIFGRSTVRSGLVLGLILTTLVGCSDDPLDPRTQITNQIEYLEGVAEKKDISTLFDYVDNDYTDNKGFTKRAIATFMRMRMMQQKTVNILSRISSINIINDNSAEVVVYAGVSGTEADTFEDSEDLAIDLVRVRLAMKKDGDRWITHAASWHAASIDEIFEN